MLLPRNKDYTSKSYEALYARTLESMQSVFPDWSDYSDISIETFILQMTSGYSDMNNYYSDHILKEVTINRAKTFRALYNHANITKLDNYSMFFWIPSFVAVSITNTTGGDIIVTSMSRFNNHSSVESMTPEFYILRDYNIASGETIKTLGYYISIEEETFAVTGERNFEHLLNREYYFSTLELVDSLGRKWSRVNYLTDYSSDDLVYTLVVERYDKIYLKFGDGLNGALPEKDLVFTIKYAVKGSSDTVYLNANDISDIDVYDPISGAYASGYEGLEVDQPEPSILAVAPATIERVKEILPKTYKQMEGLVLKDDMTSFATNVLPNIIAKSYLWTKPEVGEAFDNTGVIVLLRSDYISSTDTVDLTEVSLYTNDTIVSMVKENLYDKAKVIGFTKATLDVQIANMLDIKIVAYVQFQSFEGKTRATQTNEVLSKMIEFFRPTNIEDGTLNPNGKFGNEYKHLTGNYAEIPLGVFQNIIYDSENIYKISTISNQLLINDEHKDLKIGFQRYPRVTELVLIDMITLEKFTSYFTAPAGL